MNRILPVELLICSLLFSVCTRNASDGIIGGAHGPTSVCRQKMIRENHETIIFSVVDDAGQKTCQNK